MGVGGRVEERGSKERDRENGKRELEAETKID